jgi:hypothetical protein
MSDTCKNPEKNEFLNIIEVEYKNSLRGLKLTDLIREMYMDWYSNTVICLSGIKNQTIKAKIDQIFEKLYTEIYAWHGTESQFMIARCDRILWAVEIKTTGTNEIHTIEYQKFITKTQK